MYIAGYQKLTLLDYPTKVAAICFTAGCQLRCAYCHNADLVMCKNNQFDKTLNQTESFLRYVEKRKACLEGVVISGGEPLLQENIENFAAEIKKLGLQVKLDTNGLLPERLNRLLEQKQLTMWRWIIKIVINIGMIQWGCIKAKSKNQIK